MLKWATSWLAVLYSRPHRKKGRLAGVLQLFPRFSQCLVAYIQLAESSATDGRQRSTMTRFDWRHARGISDWLRWTFWYSD